MASLIKNSALFAQCTPLLSVRVPNSDLGWMGILSSCLHSVPDFSQFSTCDVKRARVHVHCVTIQIGWFLSIKWYRNFSLASTLVRMESLSSVSCTNQT